MNRPAQTSIFNDSFTKYLKTVGIDNPAILKRCKLIFGLCDKMTRETINDIYINDVGSSGEVRNYDSLWCFTNNYAIEAKEFLIGVRLEIIPIGQRISHWAVNAVDYDLGEPVPASKLTLTFIAQGMVRELKAVGLNCKYLAAVIEKTIKPNMPFG
jgi:hypothetical protein